ncbi:hypothetical protein E8Q33_10245 [Methylophaga sp. SB9B]|uniref:hypothetical protein n=1 Tax=Methylophaga sp. SB9B TaxID=2570356 RepID=UPI0010A82AF7|nr:hypothetical protein [Methylophaga sp. SB9B]THK41161.1 hypothetical protein E8Q33_10245 [Methylophaga sp. SB9B]
MSLIIAEKLRKIAEKRRKKRPLIRAILSKLLNPSSRLMVYTPANFDNPYQTLLYSAFKKIIIAPTTADKFLRYQKLGMSSLLHIHWDEDFSEKMIPIVLNRHEIHYSLLNMEVERLFGLYIMKCPMKLLVMKRNNFF